MAKRAIRVKTNTKVVKSSGGKNSPVKVKSSSNKGGFFTEKVALNVKMIKNG